MTIDSWVRKRTYDAFREFVGSGMNYHLQVKPRPWVSTATQCEPVLTGVCLQGNEFIRDVFELGPPILVDSATMKAMKISRFERVRMTSDPCPRTSRTLTCNRSDPPLVSSTCTTLLRSRPGPRPGASSGTRGWTWESSDLQSSLFINLTYFFFFFF